MGVAGITGAGTTGAAPYGTVVVVGAEAGTGMVITGGATGMSEYTGGA
jgi:hypothetical protein